MVNVAREMKRRNFEVPLLIGGATTSRQHTAVKIAPAYDHPVIHVLDASRAVNVVASLLDAEKKVTLAAEARADQERLRQAHAGQQKKPLIPIAEARAKRAKLEFGEVPIPKRIGTRLMLDQPLGEIARYIDWSFFFSAWELPGKFPSVLDDKQYGPVARELYDNAQDLLHRIVAGKMLRANAVYGFWPAASDGDDIVLLDAERSQEIHRFSMLRQQVKHDDGPCRSLADFVAPLGSGVEDYIGAFAVTAGIGEKEASDHFAKQYDDYDAIMIKALADRLAEAFAEYLHERARREWGYGKGEKLTSEDLIDERYRGIRPAFGYPACPDHSEKETLCELLTPSQIGVSLTESFMMIPAASVSGLYFSHPSARYFNVGRIGRDQVEDYARRKSISVEQAERYLQPNLAYDPAEPGRINTEPPAPPNHGRVAQATG